MWMELMVIALLFTSSSVTSTICCRLLPVVTVPETRLVLCSAIASNPCLRIVWVVLEVIVCS